MFIPISVLLGLIWVVILLIAVNSTKRQLWSNPSVGLVITIGALVWIVWQITAAVIWGAKGWTWALLGQPVTAIAVLTVFTYLHRPR